MKEREEIDLPAQITLPSAIDASDSESDTTDSQLLKSPG